MTDKQTQAPQTAQQKPSAPTPPPPSATPQPAAAPQKPQEKPQESKPPVVLPEHLAAYAAREGEWIKKEIEYKTKIAELEKAQKAAQEYERLVSELKTDPYAVAERHGASLENWAKRTIHGDPRKPTTEELVPKLLEEVRAMREQYEKQAREVQAAAHRSDAAVYASEMIQHMQGMKGEWEPVRQYMDVIGMMGGQEPDLVGAVQQMITSARQAGGKLLTPAEACDSLRQEAQKFLTRLSSVISAQQAQAQQSSAAPAPSPQATITQSDQTAAAAAEDLAALPPDKRLEIVTRKLMSGAYDRK